jgi:hypothetical protein
VAKPKNVEKNDLDDKNLESSYKKANFGVLSEPATILDRHGKIMAWALPDVLHPNRVVRWPVNIFSANN